jgi:hypothetical protein
MHRRLDGRKEFVVIYHEEAYPQMPLVSFARELLELEPQARRKALDQIRRLEQSLLSPLKNLRPP